MDGTQEGGCGMGEGGAGGGGELGGVPLDQVWTNSDQVFGNISSNRHQTDIWATLWNSG